MSGENGTGFAGLGLGWSGDGLFGGSIPACPGAQSSSGSCSHLRGKCTAYHLLLTYHTFMNLFYLVNLSLVKRNHMFQDFFVGAICFSLRNKPV